MAEIGNCFLTFDPVNQGSLIHTWSKGNVETALIKGVSTIGVPAHKFKGKGTSEITRGLQSEKKRFYAGTASFIKLGKPYKCVYEVKEGAGPIQFMVVLHKTKNDLIKDPKKFDLEDIDCVAVVPKACNLFDVKTMDMSLFESQGNNVGAALRL